MTANKQIVEINVDKAVMEELKSIERQKEEWIAVCGYIKSMIGDYDHVNDDPLKLISGIIDILDAAFCYMPAAIEEINKAFER